MKTPKQVQIADYFGISQSFLSELRAGKKYLSKQTAKFLSDTFGLPYSFVALTTGESLYRELETVFLKTRETQERQ